MGAFLQGGRKFTNEFLRIILIYSKTWIIRLKASSKSFGIKFFSCIYSCVSGRDHFPDAFRKVQNDKLKKPVPG